MQRDLYKKWIRFIKRWIRLPAFAQRTLLMHSQPRYQVLSGWVGENPGNEINAIFPRINDEFSLSFLLIVATAFQFFSL